jgi:hypothetical protein
MNYIRKHNLKGYHVRGNSDLSISFYEEGIQIRKYPTYMIVNKEGKITNSDAARPSDIETLKDQLQQTE